MTDALCLKRCLAPVLVRRAALLCAVLLLGFALPEPARATVDLCKLFPGHPTLCPDSCKGLKRSLEALEEKFESDYERWQDLLKTHRCYQIKHGETDPTYKSALGNATGDVKDTSENIKAVLKEAKEKNCSASDPRSDWETPACKRARIDLDCYKKLEDDLKWELKKMFGETAVGWLASKDDVCKHVERNNDYGRCRQIINTELDGVQKAIKNNENNVRKNCGG